MHVSRYCTLHYPIQYSSTQISTHNQIFITCSASQPLIPLRLSSRIPADWELRNESTLKRFKYLSTTSLHTVYPLSSCDHRSIQYEYTASFTSHYPRSSSHIVDESLLSHLTLHPIASYRSFPPIWDLVSRILSWSLHVSQSIGISPVQTCKSLGRL